MSDRPLQITAAIFPTGPMSDETVDTVVSRALAAGLVPCNPRRGPFRVAFFPPKSIPATWSRIGCVAKPETAPCVA